MVDNVSYLFSRKARSLPAPLALLVTSWYALPVYGDRRGLMRLQASRMEESITRTEVAQHYILRTQCEASLTVSHSTIHLSHPWGHALG